MIETINELITTPMGAMIFYVVLGLVFFVDMQRIRWYTLCAIWLTFGSFERGFFGETAMLGLTFMLSETLFFRANFWLAKARLRRRAEKNRK